jgi:membrane protein YdbS with pleckstrin-like domain
MCGTCAACDAGRAGRARDPAVHSLLGHPGGVPYPDKLLAADEEVVAHLHPHGLTLFWPVVRFLLVVGAASFGMAAIPAGPQQGLVRMVVLAPAVLLLLLVVLVPLLRWRSTHYVITTHRLLVREGVLSRRGRDLALSRITDVSFRQTLWERVIRSGTISIQSGGESGPTVLRRVPDCDGAQHLLNHMIEEDADRRVREGAEYLGDRYGPRASQPWDTATGDTVAGDTATGDTATGDTAAGVEDFWHGGTAHDGAWGTGSWQTRHHEHH